MRERASMRNLGGLFTSVIVLLLVLAQSRPARLWAKPTTSGQARKVVRGWLKVSPKPLGTALDKHVGKADVFTDDGGQSAYYVVYLEPAGFVIVPADDLVEPIIAFVAEGAYDPSDDNPLGALVSADVPARVAAARDLQNSANNNAQGTDTPRKQALEKVCSRAQEKWGTLQTYDDMAGVTGLSGVSDVRVDPLVKSKWSQSSECSQYCYNYYTPEHYVCGCVATAMAQLMRFHEHPTEGIGVHTCWITVDGQAEQASTLGGNGSGGAYRWSYMVLDPTCDNYTDERWEAIGALCYDAGVSVYMDYSGGGSGATLFDTKNALTGIFGYSNTVRGYKYHLDIGAPLTAMINPGLDAGYPVILGIRRPGSGHAVICDGYGYDTSTLYHHLNMGWAGASDAWYDLPEVLSYDTVDTCLYNIFTSASGEIISGRITDPAGIPISGALVTANSDAAPSYTATSNDKGIYALAKVPSNTTFTVTVTKSGWSFSNQIVATGTSTQNSTACGNLWGIDCVGIISTGSLEFDKEAYTIPETISVRLMDHDLLDSGSQAVLVKTCGGDRETVSLSENPVGSGAFEGAIPTAEVEPVLDDGTIQVSGTETIVCVYEDANDGTGRPATATHTATVTGTPAVIFQADFAGGLPAGWSTVDQGDSVGDTWTWTNPGRQSSSYWSGTFMIADSSWFGWLGYGVMDEQLVTHQIDCSDYTGVKLRFHHYFRCYVYGRNEICDVDIRVGGGAWQNLARYQEADAYGLVQLDLSAYADGQPDVQVRWHYYNANYEYYWGIDNVQITAVAPLEEILGDFEPDCDVDFHDFAVLALAWRSGDGDAYWNPACDLSDPRDGLIDEKDLKALTDNWLAGTGP